MNKKIVLNIEPTKENSRNSEGSFFRGLNEEIFYAYSRYNSGDFSDHASCDIALICSKDEGETWSDFKLIARAADLGVKNIMCASALPLSDGKLCVYFLIKENNGTTTIGRTISCDGVNFEAERCICNMPDAYYVIENDRFIRLLDGRIAVAAAKYGNSTDVTTGDGLAGIVSDNDGREFHIAGDMCRLPFDRQGSIGLEEPEIIELSENCIWILARSMYSYQYQAFSYDGMKTFTAAEPSVFSSPLSPISLKRLSDNSIIAAYNPIPNFDGRAELVGDMLMEKFWSGRTPLVLRISRDNGNTWGKLHPIENERNVDYSYPALFETNDGGILCAYWCVSEGNKCSMRIAKCERIYD